MQGDWQPSTFEASAPTVIDIWDEMFNGWPRHQRERGDEHCYVCGDQLVTDALIQHYSTPNGSKKVCAECHVTKCRIRRGGDPLQTIELRSPCSRCGATDGTIETKSGQDVVRCSQCCGYQYCAPKTESGRATRTVRRTPFPPSIRWAVMERARGRCEACGIQDSPAFHIGHLLSVKDGTEEGFSEEELADLDNLVWLCEECNLGNLRGSVHPVFWLALVRRRGRLQQLTEN